jgi:hypothetical protein
VTEVPELFACEVCQLEVEGGLGPGGLAWHNCEQVLILRASSAGSDDEGSLRTRLLRTLVQEIEGRAPQIAPKELASLLESASGLEATEKGSGELSKAFRDWMEGADVDPDPLGS